METIRVDTSQVLNRLSGRPFGININYLRDHDANRPWGRPLVEAIRETGSGHLRYPGGGKSDRVLFDRGQPQPLEMYRDFARQHRLLSLDDFVKLCRDTGAEPHVVVAYDRVERTGIEEDVYLENAVNLLRYANVEKGYGIAYWEIGNENWNNKPATPQQIGQAVRRIAMAMKAVDPSISICVSGVKEAFWAGFLPAAGDCIDCLVVSQYSCMDWRSYSYFTQHQPKSLVGNALEALNCLEKYLPSRAADMAVIVTELNSKDYADLFDRPYWADDNNLGHSIVTFCILAELLQVPKVSYGMLWNTRWMDQQEEHLRIWYGLDRDNQLLPSAMPLKLLGRFLLQEVLACEPPPGLVCLASKSQDSRSLTVFIVNKMEQPLALPEIQIADGGYALKAAWRYGGTGAADLRPQLLSLQPQALLDQPLPGVSISILAYEGASHETDITQS